MGKGLTVTRKTPCPICHNPDWCGISDDEHAAICMRIQSTKQTKNGGWLHWLKKPPPIPRQCLDFAPHDNVLRRSMGSVMAGIEAGAPFEGLAGEVVDLFGDLYPFITAAEVLGGVWSSRRGALAMPMRGSKGEITGIRYRDHEGRKWSERGTIDGLFFDPSLLKVPFLPDLYICEGLTDTIALGAIGFPVIGRSSCATGGAIIRTICDALHVRRITLICDNDATHVGGGGQLYMPGRQGALRLAKSLNRPTRFYFPPSTTKDARGEICALFTRLSDAAACKANLTIRFNHILEVSL